MVTYYHAVDKMGNGMKFAFLSRTNIQGISAKSDGKWIDVSGFGVGKFYDTEEEMNKCLAMSEQEFEDMLIATFLKLGYAPQKKEVEIMQDGKTELVLFEPKLVFVRKENATG